MQEPILYTPISNSRPHTTPLSPSPSRVDGLDYFTLVSGEDGKALPQALEPIPHEGEVEDELEEVERELREEGEEEENGKKRRYGEWEEVEENGRKRRK